MGFYPFVWNLDLYVQEGLIQLEEYLAKWAEFERLFPVA